MDLTRTEEFDVVYVGEETEVNTVPLTADQQNPLYNSLVGKVEITHYAFETRNGKEKFSFPAFDVPKNLLVAKHSCYKELLFLQVNGN